jgi:hypothetical protein
MYLFSLFNIHPLGAITALFSDFCEVCFLGMILNSGWACGETVGGTGPFPSPCPPQYSNTITVGIKAILKHNYFQFQNKYCKQSNGSPM